MGNIVVFNRYANKPVTGFSVPFSESVRLSLQDLGLTVSVINEYSELSDVRDSLLLLIISPQNLFVNTELVHNSNTVVWWNLEPIDLDGSTPKLKSARDTVDKLVDNPLLHRILFFNKNQCDLYDCDNVGFLPIGYHECMSLCGLNYGEKKPTIIFAGDRSAYRNSFMNLLNSKLRGITKVKHLGHKKKLTLERNKTIIGKHRFGLDCPSEMEINHIHWHRIMMYAANQTIVVTPSDLSEYGIEHGKHYIKFGKEYDCATAFKNLVAMDQGELIEIAENMLYKVQTDFSMAKLFEREILGKK